MNISLSPWNPLLMDPLQFPGGPITGWLVLQCFFNCSFFGRLDPLCLLTGQSLGDQCYSHSQTTSKPKQVFQQKKTTKERTLFKEVFHHKSILPERNYVPQPQGILSFLRQMFELFSQNSCRPSPLYHIIPCTSPTQPRVKLAAGLMCIEMNLVVTKNPTSLHFYYLLFSITTGFCKGPGPK